MPRDDLRVRLSLETALLLVELAEEIGDLAPAEADAVESARVQIDRIVERRRRILP